MNGILRYFYLAHAPLTKSEDKLIGVQQEITLMFAQTNRTEVHAAPLTSHNLRLKFLPSIPSIFELPQCSDPRRKICMYSHPAYWRAMLEEEIVSQAGKATTKNYVAQNGRVKKYFDRLAHGEKYVGHEENFERLVRLSSITGVDLVFSIPCPDLSGLTSTEAHRSFAKIQSHLQAYLCKVFIHDQADLEPSLKTFIRLGRVYFYPSNATDGKLCRSLMKLPGFESAYASVVQYLSERVIIPSGGCADRCLRDMLKTLRIKRTQLQVFDETIYTDTPERRGTPSEDEGATRPSDLFVPIRGDVRRQEAIRKLAGRRG